MPKYCVGLHYVATFGDQSAIGFTEGDVRAVSAADAVARAQADLRGFLRWSQSRGGSLPGRIGPITWLGVEVMRIGIDDVNSR